jgi:hypothetical protein
MLTPHKSRRSQPLSNSDDSNEESTNDEHKKKRRKNCKEQDDGYWRGVFCQKCHNESHLTKKCKIL